MNRRFFTPHVWYCLAMAALLVSGIYLRWAGLGRAQHFVGDQGRDYLEVMNWIWDGHWPLVGPQRITGDYTIGPGWYYTLAPALALTGFHPAAGAGWIGLLCMLGALIGGEWIRRATGSRLAALTVVAVYAWSMNWVFDGRMLWNPNVLPLGVMGLPLIIRGIGRKPAAGMALSLMLLAILPHWHTTGYMVVLAAAPLIVVAGIRARRAALALPWRTWALWGSGLGICIALLYGPPVIYELRPGPGNLKAYLTRTVIPSKPDSKPAPERAMAAFERLALGTVKQALPARAALKNKPAVQGVAALIALLALVLIAVRMRQGAFECGAGYLMLLCLGYSALLTLKGQTVQDYFLTAFHPAALLLSGWVMGELLRSEKGPRAWRIVRRIAGGALATLFIALSIQQLPNAWAMRKPQPWQRGQTLADTLQVVDWIAQDAGKRPFSLWLLQEGGAYPAHHMALLRRRGLLALNTADYRHRGVRRRSMGEQVYLVDMTKQGPAECPLSKMMDPPRRVGDICRIWTIQAARLDPAVREVKLIVQPQGQWTMEGLHEEWIVPPVI